MLIFNQDVGSALSKACKQDSDSVAVYLSQAAYIVRRDMLKIKNKFSGSFGTKCQKESVPVSLLALVSMLINRPNIEAQSSSSPVPQPILAISQLLMYNSLMRRRNISLIVKVSSEKVRRNFEVGATTTRHNHEQKTPLPVYLGMMVHTLTRKCELVDSLYKLGLSVSYEYERKI